MSDGPRKDRQIPRKDALRAAVGIPSFTQMDELFRTVLPHGERGNIRRDLTPRSKQAHHVGMSWENEQQAFYAEAAEGFLVDFLSGTSDNPDYHPDSLTQRIQRIGLDTAKSGKIHYGRVLKTALFEAFTEFAQMYPQWIPAVAGMYRIGAVPGTGIISGLSERFLSYTQANPDLREDAPLNRNTMHTFMNEEIAHDKFSRVHTSGTEVWCPGETVAKTIVDLSRVAAVLLAEDQTVRRAYYKPSPEEKLAYYANEDIAFLLRDYTQELLLQLQIEYSQDITQQ